MATFDQLSSVLYGEVGYHEGYSGGHWNNIEKYAPQIPELSWAQGQPWCAVFTTWAYRTAGVKDGTFAVTASVQEAMDWYKSQNRWSEYPSLGAQVILGGNVHTGIVVSFDNDYITTVEGNTNTDGSAEGNGVYVRRRYRRDDFVTGYGSPDFDTVGSGDEPFPGAGFFFVGQNSDIITHMGERLVAEGCSAYQSGPSPDWTEADRQSYSLWQQKLGYTGTDPGGDADGYPGPDSWAKLHVPR